MSKEQKPERAPLTEAQIIAAINRIPYAKLLGVRPLLMGHELTMVLPYAQQIIGNPVLPALHGGAVGAFMEITAILQLQLTGTYSRLPKPIGININYLRRGHPKDTFARAFIARQGKRVANVQTRAWQDSYDTPIATLHGHFMMAKDDG